VIEDEVWVIAPRRRDGGTPKAVKCCGPDEISSTGASLMFHAAKDAVDHLDKFPPELVRVMEVRRAHLQIGDVFYSPGLAPVCEHGNDPNACRHCDDKSNPYV
jgi:hypothetical protein